MYCSGNSLQPLLPSAGHVHERVSVLFTRFLASVKLILNTAFYLCGVLNLCTV